MKPVRDFSAPLLVPAVRPDLAAVPPIYYPIIEQERFGSVSAMCRRYGWPMDLLSDAIDRAAVEQSGLVVVESLALGNPADKASAVLLLQPGGAVVLCAGLFAELSEDADDVKALLAEFGRRPEFKGRLLAVGEFRPNPQGVPS